MARKEKKYHFIYKTTNILTGYYYYGMHSTDNLEDNYLGSGKRLRYSINKYGKENHEREIIEFCENRKELSKRESEIVNLNEIAKKKCMNFSVGGLGGYQSPEQQRKRSIAGRGAVLKKYKEDQEYAKQFRKKLSIGLKRAHSNGKYINKKYNLFEGLNHTEETKRKISQSMKGKQTGKLNSQFGTCWINKDNIVKKIKKEELENYKDWSLGRKNSYVDN